MTNRDTGTAAGHKMASQGKWTGRWQNQYGPILTVPGDSGQQIHGGWSIFRLDAHCGKAMVASMRGSGIRSY